jgi:hypothetical protein
MQFYDKAGSPISLDEFGLLCEDDEYRTVAVHRGRRGGRRVWVSTVWLGLDYTFGMGPYPLIFETMVFGDSSWSGYAVRYPTEGAARAGHADIVARINRGEGRPCAD